MSLALLPASLPGCGAEPDDAGPPGSDPHPPDGGMGPPGGAPMEPAPNIPAWVQTARLGGLYLNVHMDEEEIDRLLRERKAQNVSVIELDTRLSEYLDEEEFAAEVAFLDRTARKAHDLDMRVVAYYPSLEVITPDGERAASSMYKDHPDWVQVGISGEPNVFYGSREVWVEPGAESAWMSPNSRYRDYFLDRVRRLADTALDGVWVDVPLYLETGAAWAGAEPAAREAFRQWALDRGLDGAGGFLPPSAIDFDDLAFRAWVKWRHENLADFVEDVRRSAQQARPDFLVAIENFPLDYMGGTTTGLDGTLRRSGQSFLRVWEVDSVSNTLGMQWATIEDFTSKIAMYKWAAAAERENLPWSFVYGNQPLDAGLVMAAAVATRNLPFECKTPEMTETVDHDFRARWFGFLRDHEEALFGTPRLAQVGVWYSAATRDYQDLVQGGGFGMYITTEPPTRDPDWWAQVPGDSALPKPHLGSWRGAAHALIQLRVPFEVVTDPGEPAAALQDLSLLWLPSVAAMSETAAAEIGDFVARGGTVLATGGMPAMLDELGTPRARSALADVFGFGDAATSGARANPFGQGVALYRPDLDARDVFALAGDPADAAVAMSAIEQLVRVHVPDVVRLDDAPAGVHVEVSRPRGDDDGQYLYVVNFSGLQQPLVRAPVDLQIEYRPPPGRQVLSAHVATPDPQGRRGAAPVTPLSDGSARIDLRVDQLALIELTLGPAAAAAPAPYAGPSFATEERREAAESALRFVLDHMRDPSLPEPLSFGVRTNLLDRDEDGGIYAHGHNVTAEHMGLLLWTSACMKDQTTYRQAYRYVRDVMLSPTYHLINWAIDADTLAPLVELGDDGDDDGDGVWRNANAPLDDLRVIRGLLAGPRQAGVPGAAALAERALRGLYWTTVTDRDHDTARDLPAYPGGLLGFAWDWSERDDASLSPPAVSTGLGRLTMDPIPVDYQDLYTISAAARLDARWRAVLTSATDLLLRAEIGDTGLFWNGMQADGAFTGDFENQDEPQGEHLKVIQVLWIALHLARASAVEDHLLDPARKHDALAAARRSLTFFRAFHDEHDRVPEYLTTSGGDVPDCTGEDEPEDCLERGDTNLFHGEARIYAQLARLALLLDDRAFAARIIERGILSDRIDDPTDPRYGLIGASTTSEGDAEAWNVLESLLTLCLEAGGE